MEQADTKILYSRLRRLRDEIAVEKNIPVYMVFPNKTLGEMALYMPTSLNELSSIYGVGKTKLKQFGEVFLNEINRFKQEYDISANLSAAKDLAKDSNVTTIEEDDKEIAPIEVSFAGAYPTDILISVPEKATYSFAINNYDELKKSLQRILANYEHVVYTPSQLKQAKQDKSTLTKLKRALAARSKELKDICLEPYYSVAEQFKELQRMIDAPLVKIAEFTSAMDQMQKDSKSVEIKLYYDAHAGKLGVLAEPIYCSTWFYDKKWENKTTPDWVWQYQLLQKIENTNNVIAELSTEAGENASAVIAKYIESGDREKAHRFLQAVVSIRSDPINSIPEKETSKKGPDNPPDEINNEDIQVDSRSIGIIPKPQQTQRDNTSAQNEEEDREIIQHNQIKEKFDEKFFAPEEEHINEDSFTASSSDPEKQTEVMLKIVGTKQQFEAVLRFIDKIGADYQVYIVSR